MSTYRELMYSEILPAVNTSYKNLLETNIIKEESITYEKLVMKNGLFIEIYDNVLSEEDHDKFFQYSKKLNYELSGIEKYPLFFHDTKKSAELLKVFLQFKPFEEVYNKGFISKSWSTYMNKMVPEDYGYHIDHIYDKGCNSIIYYPHKEWDYDWGGDIIFMNVDLSYGYSVIPKPNRIIIFNSQIPHTFSKVKVNNVDRYSLVLLVASEEKYIDNAI